MFVINKLSGFIAILLVLCLVIPAPVAAKNRKGDKFYKQAQKAETAKDWELALSLYEQALQQDPGEMFYRTGVLRARFQAGQLHVDKGIKLRNDGQLDAALAEFQRAFALDPSSSIALQEIKNTSAMIDKAKQGSSADTPRGSATKMEDERISSLMAPPELKPIEGHIKNLKMNNQPVRVLYETVGALAGINVILDPNFQNMGGKNANVDLNNATLEEALDYIALQTHTFWKPVNSNTIFVAEENPTKRRDYDDMVVKVFYLKNTTSPQEFTELLNTVRSVTDIRRIFPYSAQSAAVVRGTPDQIAIAEKLFHDLDKAKAEVVVDIVLLSTDITRTRNIASALNSAGGGGINLPIGFTPRSSITVSNSNNNNNGTGTPGSTNNNTNNNNNNNNNGNNNSGSAVALSNILKIGSRDFSISLPGALLQAMLEDSSTRVMQSPQVRASDGMKVTLKVGQKYPYATGSYQPGVGSVGVSPLVSTQFQFLDTGVDLEVTPHVHGTEDVTLHIDIKLSNVQSTINLGGLSQPIVAQQANATDVRLRDGQVALLGGILSSNDTSDVTGIPGIMNIPALGQFLGAANNKKRSRDELIIALIPHIVRVPDLQEADFRGVFSGTETTPRVMRAPEAENKPAPGAPASPATATPSAQQPSPAAPVPGAPATSVPVPAAPAPAPPAPAPPKPPGAPPEANSAALKLSFQPADAHVKSGAPVALTLQAENANDLFSAPVKIKWDPTLLRLDTANPGALVTQGGQNMRTPSAIHNDTGEATLNLARIPGAGGISGTGSLATLNFVALRKGSGKVTVSEVEAKNSRLEHMEASKPEIVINVE